MAGYVPFYMKKTLFLRSQEERLREAIRKGVDETKLLKAAEAVRDARLIAMRAKRRTLVAGSLKELAAKRAKLDPKIAMVCASTPQSVIADFRSSKKKASLQHSPDQNS